MEAKYTIMVTEGCNKFRDGSCVRNCCNTRADKGYKAGYTQAIKDYKESQVLGMEKVVEWIYKHEGLPGKYQNEWQAFLSQNGLVEKGE